MKKGLLSVFFAYVLWGFFPVYFKLLHAAPAMQIMTHRVVWSLLFLLLLVLFRGEIKATFKGLTKKALILYVLAGFTGG